MTRRDYVKSEIDALPEDLLEKIQEYISFQRFSRGLYESDSDYLDSLPGMAASIREGAETPLADCVSLSEVWPDV